MTLKINPQSHPQNRACTESVQWIFTDSVQEICADSVFANLVARICVVRIPYKAQTQKLDTSLLFAQFWSQQMYGIRTRQFGPQ